MLLQAIKEVFKDERRRPSCAMAFKITDETIWAVNLYKNLPRGIFKQGETVYNTRTKKKQRVGRMVQMFSNDKKISTKQEQVTSSLWLVLTVHRVILM